MISLWRKKHTLGWRAGLFLGERGPALAVVQQRPGQLPLLHHCRTHALPAEQVLATQLPGRLAHAPLSVALPAAAYQMVQVEAPQVPAAELRAAVRWKLRDLINFAVDEAVVDVFDAPPSPRRGQEKMLYAVAARQAAVDAAVQLNLRTRTLDAIDIPEMCLRNLSALLPQDERGVALLTLEDHMAQLLITRQGTLYLSRRIELQRRGLTLEAEASIDTATLALEIQRSVDYYESHFDQSAVSALVLAPDNAQTRALADGLQRDISLSIGLFAPMQHFAVEDGAQLDVTWSTLVALGAALRSPAVAEQAA